MPNNVPESYRAAENSVESISQFSFVMFIRMGNNTSSTGSVLLWWKLVLLLVSFLRLYTYTCRLCSGSSFIGKEIFNHQAPNRCAHNCQLPLVCPPKKNSTLIVVKLPLTAILSLARPSSVMIYAFADRS